LSKRNALENNSFAVLLQITKAYKDYTHTAAAAFQTQGQRCRHGNGRRATNNRRHRTSIAAAGCSSCGDGAAAAGTPAVHRPPSPSMHLHPFYSVAPLQAAFGWTANNEALRPKTAHIHHLFLNWFLNWRRSPVARLIVQLSYK
jgi:hypothetical protein